MSRSSSKDRKDHGSKRVRVESAGGVSRSDSIHIEENNGKSSKKEKKLSRSNTGGEDLLKKESEKKQNSKGKLKRHATQAQISRSSAALFHAVQRDDMKRIATLLEKGSDPDSRDETGNTPLIVASYLDKPEAVKLLLENGANIDAQNNEGITAIFVASIRGCISSAKILVEHDANCDIYCSKGQHKWKTPIEVACMEQGTVRQKRAMKKIIHKSDRCFLCFESLFFC